MQFAKKADGRGVQIAFAGRAVDCGDLEAVRAFIVGQSSFSAGAQRFTDALARSERLESSQPSRRVASMPRDEPQN